MEVAEERTRERWRKRRNRAPLFRVEIQNAGDTVKAVVGAPVSVPVRGMRRQVVKDEAEKLRMEFGEGAYEKARAAMREARRRRNVRLERYFAKVAVEIAAVTKKKIGEDTATRYLS
jgi:hypothetical protein